MAERLTAVIVNAGRAGSESAQSVRRARRLVDTQLPFCRGEVQIHFLGPKEMTRLHQRLLHRSGPTNVISQPLFSRSELATLFPQLSSLWGTRFRQRTFGAELRGRRALNLGDLFLCSSFIRLQARTLGQSPSIWLEFLTVHGLLHLLGFDHHSVGEVRAMEAIEKRIMPPLKEAFHPLSQHHP